MMTKKSSTPQTRVKTKTRLSPLEEQVVRMRHGLRAPESLVLEQRGEGNPELTAELAQIEQRALSAAGARHSSAKRKIVGSLRRKHR